MSGLHNRNPALGKLSVALTHTRFSNKKNESVKKTYLSKTRSNSTAQNRPVRMSRLEPWVKLRGGRLTPGVNAPTNEMIVDYPQKPKPVVRQPRGLVLAQVMDNQMSIVRGLNRVINRLNTNAGGDDPALKPVTIRVNTHAIEQNWRDAVEDEFMRRASR